MKSQPFRDLEEQHPRQREQQVQSPQAGSDLGTSVKQQGRECGCSLISDGEMA